jgi:hypothetical protein
VGLRDELLGDLQDGGALLLVGAGEVLGDEDAGVQGEEAGGAADLVHQGHAGVLEERGDRLDLGLEALADGEFADAGLVLVDEAEEGGRVPEGVGVAAEQLAAGVGGAARPT